MDPVPDRFTSNSSTYTLQPTSSAHDMAPSPILWFFSLVSSTWKGLLALIGLQKPKPVVSKTRKPLKSKTLKNSKSKKQTAPTMAPAVEDHSEDFLKRSMVPIPGVVEGGGLKMTIMTYNVLAQALVSRKQFPESGPILRWALRFKVLKKEIAYYSPTVLCLQEVDVLQITSWKLFLRELDYLVEILEQNSKKHCLMIAYKWKVLDAMEKKTSEYDETAIPDVPHNVTKNSYLLVKFHFTSAVTSQFPYLLSRGLIVGTTHLYWHPQGCFDRARQNYLLVDAIGTWADRSASLEPAFKYSALIAGDFNSEPFDAPYLLMTTKALSNTDLIKEKLKSSYENLNNPFAPTSTDVAVSNLITKHMNLEYRSESLYSLAYYLVQETEKQPCNEPQFSNWTPLFKGMLDYIFVVSKCEANESFPAVDSLENFVKRNGFKILKLLRLPTRDEMKVPGLPKIGWSPSDHLAVMAELEVAEL